MDSGAITKKVDKWVQRINNSTNSKAKEEELKKLLQWFLSFYCSSEDLDRKNLADIRYLKQVAHLVSIEFMKEVDRQCELCGDNDEKLLDYLKKDHGALLLLAIVVLAEKITSCSEELSKLLVSILALAMKVTDPKMYFESSVLSLGDLMFSVRTFNTWREDLKKWVIRCISETRGQDLVKEFSVELNGGSLFLALYISLLDISLLHQFCKDQNARHSLLKQIFQFCLLPGIQISQEEQAPALAYYIVVLVFAFCSNLPSSGCYGDLVLQDKPILTDIIKATVEELKVVSDGSQPSICRVNNSSEILVSTLSLLFWCSQIKESTVKYNSILQVFQEVGLYRLLFELFLSIDRVLRAIDEQENSIICHDHSFSVVKKVNLGGKVGIHNFSTLLENLMSVMVKTTDKLKRSKKHFHSHSFSTERVKSVKRRSTSSRKVMYHDRKRKGNDVCDGSSNEDCVNGDNFAEDAYESSSSAGDIADFITKYERSTDGNHGDTKGLTNKKPDSNKNGDSGIEADWCPVSLVCQTICNSYQLCTSAVLQEFLLDTLNVIDFCECMDPISVALVLLDRLDTRCPSVRSKALNLLGQILRNDTEMLGILLAAHAKPHGPPSPNKDIEATKGKDLKDYDGGTSQSRDEQHATNDPGMSNSNTIFSRYHAYLSSDSFLQDEITCHLTMVVPSVDDEMRREILSRVVMPFLMSMRVVKEGIESFELETLHQAAILSCFHTLCSLLRSFDCLHTFYTLHGLSLIRATLQHECFGVASLKVLRWLICEGSVMTAFTQDPKQKQRFPENGLSGSRRDSNKFQLLSEIRTKAMEMVLESIDMLLLEFLEKSDIFECIRGSRTFSLHLVTCSAFLQSCEDFAHLFIERSWITKSMSLLKRLCCLWTAGATSESNSQGILSMLRGVLPIVAWLVDRELKHGKVELSSMKEIITLLEATFLNEQSFRRPLAKDLCNTLLHCSLVEKMEDGDPKGTCGNMFSPETFKAKVVANEEEELVSEPGQEEEGYDADSESDSERELPTSMYRTLRTSVSVDETGKRERIILEKPLVIHPDLILMVLKSLAIQIDRSFGEDDPANHERLIDITAHCFEILLSFVQGNHLNAQILGKKGLFLALVTKFRLLYEDFHENLRAIQGNMQTILILLCNCSITGGELREYLQLFKAENAFTCFLAETLMEMAKGAYALYGAVYSLSFPGVIHESIKKDRANVPALHKAHSFLIPRISPSSQGRSVIRYRSISWANKYDAGDQGLTPLRHELHPSAWEIALVQLPLDGKFLWPDREFSVSIWFQLEDGTELLNGDGYPRGGAIPDGRRWKSSKDFSLNHLFHLCSFGSINTLFEVWVGSKSGHLEYRWIVSDDKWNENTLHCFDQVLVHSTVSVNKWHHLYVSIVLTHRTSHPHSAEIFTFLDGCKQTMVQMKFPSQKASSQSKLHALLGHGLRSEREIHTDKRVSLKTGNFMVFTGVEPFSNLQKTLRPSARKASSAGSTRDEAIFLYALGPNGTLLSSNPQGYFASQTMRHMDSSLNWESILFRDMSFSLGILSEHLVAANFPIHLLTDTSKHAPFIQSTLQDCLLLTYCPRQFSEFTQYSFNSISGNRFSKSTDDLRGTLNRQPRKVLATLCADVTAVRQESLQQAMHDVGGMSVLLFLLAKVAESADGENAVAYILHTIFAVQERCPYLLREMNDLAGYILIQRVLHSSPCEIGFRLLQVLITCMCDGDVFLNDDACAAEAVNPHSTAIVKNVSILQVLILDWKLWKQASTALQETLWKCLEVLIRPNHPYHDFNLVQFQRVRVIDHLLTGCQERQQEKGSPLPKSVSILLIDIITHMLGQPPDLSVLKAVISFLIAVHPTLDALKLHSPGSFYLLPKLSDAFEPVAGSNVNAAKITQSRSNARSHSFTEGFSKMEKNLTRSDSNDSIISILVSEGGTSPEEKLGRNPFLLNFPKTEVLFQKRNRVSYAPNHVPDTNIDGLAKLAPADSSEGSNVEILEHSDAASQSPLTLKTGPSSDEDLKSFSSMNSDIESLGISQPPRSPDVLRGPARKKSGHKLKKTQHRRNRSLDVNLRLAAASQSTPLDSQEYDIISDSELPSSLEQHEAEEFLVVDGMTELKMSSFTPSRKSSTSIAEMNMLYHLRLGLLELLNRAILLLPDNMVPRVFGTILKVEHLLVLVSQEEENLREVAVKNLCLYLQRGGQDCLDNFKRFMGFHLLANQLHQYRATTDIVHSCFELLMGDLRFINREQTPASALSASCPDAVIACISMLEMTVFDPPVFRFLIDGLIKAFSTIENLSIVAFEYGMAGVFVNTIKTLVTADGCSMSSPWKSEVFGDLLQLCSWIIKKACCTCQTLYFQMYKDLILLLARFEAEERERKDQKSDFFIRVSRFLQYYLVEVALNTFRTTDLQSSYSRFGKKKMVSSLVENTDLSGNLLPSTKRSSVAKSIFQRIRASIVQPTIATPGELQERFQHICNEAVNLVCLYSKRGRGTDVCLYGHALRDLGVHPVHSDIDEVDTPLKEPSSNGDRLFCKGLLLFMLDAVHLSTDQSTVTSSWASLLKATKEEILTQTNRLVSHLMSPLNNHDVRLTTLEQILSRKQFKITLQGLQHSSLGAKNRDRLLMCLHSALSIPRDELYDYQVKIQREAVQMLKVCKIDLVETSEQQLWQEMHEIKIHRRQREKERQHDAHRRLQASYNSLCSKLTSQGLGVSQVLVDEQDRQRQKLLRYVRGVFSKQVEVKKVWRNLIHRHVQERSPWYVPGACPTSWQLDPTEGPSRIRKRLQRCHLDIPQRFFQEKLRKHRESTYHTSGILSYLFEDEIGGDKSTYYHFKTNDTIRFLYHCIRVTPATNTSGEVLIGETHMYFVGEEILTDNNITQVAYGDKDVTSISWRYEEISEILKRRYSLQDNALEIFLTSGRTFLLSFENAKNRDEVFDQLMSRELPNLVTNTVDLSTLAGRWRDGFVTNFEYLTELNKKAGRSFNDLMQYPVFPFVLAEYCSDQINLLEPSIFRDLSKPIAVQHASKAEKYQENYNWLKLEYERRKLEEPESATPPYHYGSHYSNSGTVLHFLVRLPPFTSMFLKYQDNQFDIPDRTFHSMSTTWHLSSYASFSDVKELIPEFFFLEEFLLNKEGFDFGTRQNDMVVDDVNLPPWANGSARLFTLIHRQALESDYVSSKLNHWIDLVFGVKQTGQAAIKAFNVFHPATYFGMDVDAIKDPIKRRATQTMIETYGQTPSQLFTQPHVQRFTKGTLPNLADVLPLGVEAMMFSGSLKEKPGSNLGMKDLTDVPSPLPSVLGLKWGDYCGSPAYSEPVMQWREVAKTPVCSVLPSTEGLLVFLLPHSSSFILTASGFRDTRHMGCLQWGRGDGLLRIRPIHGGKFGFFDPLRPDKVTCCAYVFEAEILLIGGTSGVLSAWPVKYNHDVPSMEGCGAKQNLLGHTSSITSIKVCQAYSVIVTGSEDKTAIIWDLNRLCYVRSLAEHPCSIKCLTVDNRSGDIATACSFGKEQGHLYLWTINASPVGDVCTESAITSLGFSGAPEGISVNVIAAGLANGMICMWSTWNLDLLRRFSSPNLPYPIISLSFSPWDARHLFTCDNRSNLLHWTPKDFPWQKSVTYVSLTDHEVVHFLK